MTQAAEPAAPSAAPGARSLSHGNPLDEWCRVCDGDAVDAFDLGTAKAELANVHPYARRVRRQRRPRALVVSLLLASLLAMATLVYAFVHTHVDSKGCGPVYMTPTYARMDGFDTEHTRLSSKYSLYLYREYGVDRVVEPRGVPVLFVPGNAGSYKQIRSIAAEAANQYHAQDAFRSARSGRRSLDFFTVDFNEDFSAFHGQTILDQAEYLNEAVAYILSLYHDTRASASPLARDETLPDPKSVIILAHSMGGVVARTMPLMTNYMPESVNTIITMSAPHAQPPASFDRRIYEIYQRINSFWKDVFIDGSNSTAQLYTAGGGNGVGVSSNTAKFVVKPVSGFAQTFRSEMAVVSIAGGGLDSVIASDYATISHIVPESHGFTVFTSGIPHVWTSVDHQAILWCDRLRKVMARALLDIVDVHRPEQTLALEERMRVLRDGLLTGLEPVVGNSSASASFRLIELNDHEPYNLLGMDQRLLLRQFGRPAEQMGPRIHLMPVPPTPPSGRPLVLQLMTNLNLAASMTAGYTDFAATSKGQRPRLPQADVLFCSVMSAHESAAHVSVPAVSSSSSSQAWEENGKTWLSCRHPERVVSLPSSTSSDSEPFNASGYGLQYVQYSLGRHGDTMGESDAEFVAILDEARDPTSGFLVADLVEQEQWYMEYDASLASIILTGVTLHLPADHTLSTVVSITALDSCLLAFKMSVQPNNGVHSRASLFQPIVRQSVDDPHMSRFVVNASRGEFDVDFYGTAPFVQSGSSPPSSSSLQLQLFLDPTDGQTYTVILKFDLLGSIGQLLMRFRTVLACFPIAVIALVLRHQLTLYNSGGCWIPFMDAVHMFLTRDMVPVLGLLSIVSMAISLLGSRVFLALQDYLLAGRLGWMGIHMGHILDMAIQNRLLILLGLDEPVFWSLPAAFFAMSTGIVIMASLIVQLASSTIALLMFYILPSNYLPNAIPAKPMGPAHGDHVSARRRLVTTILLLLSVGTFVPYQFAFVTACLVQASTCISASYRARRARMIAAQHEDAGDVKAGNTERGAAMAASHRANSMYNFSHSVFMLMLCQLPINVPILLVWVRNVASHWLVPFSSHHNVLSVAPSILVVEAMASNKMLPRCGPVLASLSTALLLGMALFALLWGMLHAYALHHFGNVFAGLLVLAQALDLYHRERAGHPHLSTLLAALFGNEEAPVGSQASGGQGSAAVSRSTRANHTRRRKAI